jgi:5'-3' exonuclease
MKMSDLVAKYIELRDKKAEYKAAYDAKVALIDETLDKIEAKLLQVFDDTGMDSVKTEAGTAYKSTRVSVTTGDKDAFMEFVRTNDEWPLLEVRPSKSAVEEYRQQHDDLPPGINWRAEQVVNIRRS